MNPIRSAVPGIAWPALAEPVAASLLAVLRQLEASERWPAQRLRDQQLAQFRLLFEHARATVPWYAGSLGEAPAHIDWKEFLRLPLLTRAEVQQAGAALHSSAPPPEHGAQIPYATSGSLGTPLQGVETEVSHFFWNALNLREQLWQQRDLTSRFGAIRTKVENRRLPNWGDPVARVYPTGDAVTLDIATPIAAQADWLREQRPDYLLTHPSNLRALARHLAEQNETLPLRGLGTFGETLPAATRSLCRTVFHASVADIYSAEEVGYIALQCEQRRGYHVMAENLIVEVLDDTGRPCRAGETGRVVITTLHNFAMPLIRYDIGDRAEMGEPCRCGRTLPSLKRIAGRERNMLRRPDGGQHWPSFPGELWLAGGPIRQVQLRQRRADRILVRYVSPAPLTDRQISDLSRRLAESLPFTGELGFERVDRINPGANGKFEDFVCETEGNAPPDE